MRRVLEDADNEGVTLFLDIVPSTGMQYDELRAWYVRLGFKQVHSEGTGGAYARQPQIRVVGSK
jgi:hypothetical protein